MLGRRGFGRVPTNPCSPWSAPHVPPCCGTQGPMRRARTCANTVYAARLRVRAGSGGACRARRLTITRIIAHCTPRLVVFGLAFVVNGEPAALARPGEGALQDPAAGQDLEVVDALAFADDRKGKGEDLSGPGDQLAGVAGIGPHQPDGQVNLRRNRIPASSTDTIVIATHQATVTRAWFPTGWPSSSARVASMAWVMGWLLANPWSQPGMLCAGTKALLTKVNGQISAPICWAPSTLPATRPNTASSQEKANDTSTSNPMAASHSPIPASGRKPTSTPISTIAASADRLRTAFAKMVPPRIADFTIGSERNRSMIPLDMSAAMLTETVVATRTEFAANTPGMRKSA